VTLRDRLDLVSLQLASSHTLARRLWFQTAGAAAEVVVVAATKGNHLAAKRSVALVSAAAGARVLCLRLGVAAAVEWLGARGCDGRSCRSTSADRRARIAMWNAERESGGQG
jgi:hypothetical protein